ncbi:MAG: 9-O-acetylesterase, partial [Bacteroidales bacterium]|nr:9-O-acetylesterase [Bacteroidales bacterium]
FGGPYSIQVIGGDTATINDVLIGEVWLASGQSNMEMPMGGWADAPVENGPQDIAASDNPNIRIFMVERSVSFVPEDNLKGAWKPASPANTPNFGATCYYFAKKLNADLGVPVGIINTSWGGTPVESWIPGDDIASVQGYDEKVKLINQSKGMVASINAWYDKLPKIPKGNTSYADLDLKDADVAAKDFDDSQWKVMSLPRLYESDPNVGSFDGVMWFRRTVEIPASMAGKDITLSLGAIDDMDRTYFDGTLVGETMDEGKYTVKRVYTIPAAQATAGTHTIAVRVLDNMGGGGIYDQPEDLKFYAANSPKDAVSLAGDWKYLPTAELLNGDFRIFDIPSQQFFQRPVFPINLNEQTPTTLYNAMVAPIVGYKIAGAIWYQGEANVGRAKEYAQTFPLMVTSWRKNWNQGSFPFYFVQIAPWDYGEGPSQEIREAQRLSLSTENMGMAVTMDIGNNKNIHPANKHDVGDRLAFWALNKVYGKASVQYSGPLYKSCEVSGNKLIVSFDYADGLRLASPNGFELCGADGKYYAATPKIVGDKIELSSPKVKTPVAARYLWTNCTNGENLFNAAGLPASSFCTKGLD